MKHISMETSSNIMQATTLKLNPNKSYIKLPKITYFISYCVTGREIHYSFFIYFYLFFAKVRQILLINLHDRANA